MTEETSDPTVDPRLPEAAAPPRLIVCEVTGDWALVLRRCLGEAVPVVSARSLAECRPIVDRRPASFLVLEATKANLGRLLDFLVRLGREYPLARAAVVAERRLASLEWPLREAGAVWFEVSPRDVRVLAAMVRRHLDAAPLAPRPLAEQIRQSLPWNV